MSLLQVENIKHLQKKSCSISGEIFIFLLKCSTIEKMRPGMYIGIVLVNEA